MSGNLLKELINHDMVCQLGKGIILHFSGTRNVLSSSMLNGGFHKDLQYVFNYNCLADEYECSLTYSTYEEELRANAIALGLDPALASGLSTAAFMECVSIKSEEYEDLIVTAIVTAGIDHNAVRAGDPASYYEENSHYHMLEKGTINIILHINKKLVSGAMVRAISMATEAKTAAIQELLLGSNYSHGIATGSGTDGIIIVTDHDSIDLLTDAGGHSKLGELIGQSVKNAVKEALLKQTAASPARQHTLFERGKRYGITFGRFWTTYTEYFTCSDVFNKTITISELEEKLLSLNSNSNLVVFISTGIHLMDQYQWGLLEWPEVLREMKSLCHWFLQVNHKPEELCYNLAYQCDDFLEGLITLLCHTILIRILL